MKLLKALSLFDLVEYIEGRYAHAATTITGSLFVILGGIGSDDCWLCGKDFDPYKVCTINFHCNSIVPIIILSCNWMILLLDDSVTQCQYFI